MFVPHPFHLLLEVPREIRYIGVITVGWVGGYDPSLLSSHDSCPTDSMWVVVRGSRQQRRYYLLSIYVEAAESGLDHSQNDEEVSSDDAHSLLIFFATETTDRFQHIQ